MSFDLKLSGGDIILNKDGSIALVRGNDKLRQDIIKMLLTEIGENEFHPMYGSGVGSLKIGSTSDRAIVEMDLKASVSESLASLMSLQEAQSTRQLLSPSEVIVEVVNVSVGRDSEDPRLYNIFITVLTQELREIAETITVRII